MALPEGLRLFKVAAPWPADSFVVAVVTTDEQKRGEIFVIEDSPEDWADAIVYRMPWLEPTFAETLEPSFVTDTIKALALDRVQQRLKERLEARPSRAEPFQPQLEEAEDLTLFRMRLRSHGTRGIATIAESSGNLKVRQYAAALLEQEPIRVQKKGD